MEGGEPVIRAQGNIAGFPVRVPMVDVNAIGAGGGSIAWLDGAGGLRVGPHSAGSDPGPACYGRGGEEATVTDASVVLGWLDPAYFAGGSVALDPSLARAAIERRVAQPLGMSVEDAALGIHRVVNAQMVEGIRLVSIRRGFDPRRFTLVALGGAGPIHATALAAELGIASVLIPRHPGVLSAAGLLAAPIEHEVAIAFPRPLAGLDFADVRARAGRTGSVLRAADGRGKHRPCQCRSSIPPMSGTSASPIIWKCRSTPSAPDPLGKAVSRFPCAARSYLRSCHGTAGCDRQPAGGASRRRQRSPGRRRLSPAGADPRKPPRIIRVAGTRAPVQAAIYHRAAMPAGLTFAGPAIVEQDDTTTLVEPGWRGTVLDNGNLLLTRG